MPGSSPSRYPTLRSSSTTGPDGTDVAGASQLALEDRLEGVQMGDLVVDLFGDHRCHELHQAGGLRVEREPDSGGAGGRLCQFEHSGRPEWPGDDLEFQPVRPVEYGHPVVAVDPAAAWAGEHLPV